MAIRDAQRKSPTLVASYGRAVVNPKRTIAQRERAR